MTEVNDAAKIVAQTADPSARIIFGAYYDRNLKPGQLKVTVVAAGFNGSQPGALFGANTFEGRQGMFGRSTMEGGNPNGPANALGMSGGSSMVMKKPSTPMREPGASAKDPVIHARGEESADEMMARKSLSEQTKPIQKEKESDAWDIPAFLRRRKR
jgi:hypothetical protein